MLGSQTFLAIPPFMAAVGTIADMVPQVEKNQEMFNLAQIGRADAAVTGKPAAKLYAQTHPDMIVLPEQITVEDYGMAIPQNQPETTKAIYAALVKVKAEGTYDQLVKKWFESQAK
jgi:polar amino acid transport system substrate-binding protein